MTRHLTHMASTAGLLLMLIAASGCDDPKADDNNCIGSKCDFTERPALNPVDGTLGSCELTPDTSTTDPFFQRDGVTCRFVNLDPAGVGSIGSLGVNIVGSDGNEINSVFITDSAQLDGSSFDVGFFSPDKYPITVNVTAIYDLNLNTSGLLPSLNINGSDTRHGQTHTFQQRPSETESVSFPVFFSVWPVVLWPSAELSSSWGDGQSFTARIEHTFPVTSADLIIGGAEAVSEIRYDWDIFARFPQITSLDDLTTQPAFLTVPLGDTNFTTTLTTSRVNNESTEVTTSIDGPGYYVINPDGTATRTDPTQLPALSGTTTPQPDVTDDSTIADVVEDTTSTDAVEDTAADTTPPPDPCNDTCDANTEVCVAAACVTRSQQTQSSFCDAPTKACDAGEDGDCADDHVCVGGQCRRLACQTQNSFCDTPTRPCDGDDNADCNTDHVCVDSLCRRLTCQTQNSFCDTPTRPCDGDDNADCNADHVCVAGLCRRLTCQIQNSFCDTATRPCDSDDADCAPDHTCAADLCTRNSCN